MHGALDAKGIDESGTYATLRRLSLARKDGRLAASAPEVASNTTL